MRVKAYRACLVLVIVFVLVATIAVFQLEGEKTQPMEKNTRTVSTYQYVLKEYEDKIGVYKINEEEPFRIIDVFVSTLPSSDQIDLKDGIYVQNDDKLKMIIEDYES